MKAAAFDYHRPASLADALAALRQHGEGAKLLAGGQSLVPALNLRLLAPDILIDLNGLSELKGVTLEGTRLRIGALTRHVEVERSPLVREHAPLLADAVRHVGHPAIRSRGTFGGNLAHADPASEFPACAVALEAEMIVAGEAGERRMAAEGFFRGVYETALEPDEILVAIEVSSAVMAGLVPATPNNETSNPSDRDGRDKPGHDNRGGARRHAFVELARRMGDYALVGIACTAEFADGTLRSPRPVFFAAGPQPILAKSAAALLDGKPLTAAALDEAAAALDRDIQPEGDLQISAATRLHLARTVFRRAVAALAPEAGLGRAEEIAA